MPSNASTSSRWPLPPIFTVPSLSFPWPSARRHPTGGGLQRRQYPCNTSHKPPRCRLRVGSPQEYGRAHDSPAWCGPRRGCPSWRPAQRGRPRARPRPLPTGRERSRTSTSPARTASAPRGTRTSKVWYTVAGGVLSDVYYPTVDNTNVETLQYVVTDGSTFTDLQSRDMTYTVAALDAGGMACQVTATAKSGALPHRHRLRDRPERQRGADARPALAQPSAKRPTTQLYVRFDPTVNGNGGGGTGNGGADSATVDTSTGHPSRRLRPVTATNAANRDYAQPVFAALDGPFAQATSGFAGTPSDGLVQLDAAHALTDAVLGRRGRATSCRPRGCSSRRRQARSRRARVRRHAGRSGRRSRGGSREPILERCRALLSRGLGQLRRRRSPPRRAARAGRTRNELEDAYCVSANVLKASEDKTFPGAIVASLASPWGQAVCAGDPANTYFGSYREVFARDLYEAWTGLLADGDLATARDAVAVPVRAPAARRRLDAAQQPRQRQARARLVRDAARRGGVPDPDGLPARA